MDIIQIIGFQMYRKLQLFLQFKAHVRNIPMLQLKL